MAEIRLDDVYGISRDVPRNYVVRQTVDEVFVQNLTRDRHIVVYGSSKQGKTSLRKYHLKDGDFIALSCLNNWTLRDLFLGILKRAGYTVDLGVRKTTGGKVKLAAEIGGKAKIPFVAEGDAKANLDGEGNYQIERNTKSLEIDPGDVNDFIDALAKLNFDSYIILEDFHYLPQATQKDFAFALKAIHENSRLIFIIVGVWREQNRLIALNGDLNNRVISVNADAWTKDELEDVIESGAKLLNIMFEKKFTVDLISSCFESVYLIQEACAEVCRLANVFRRQEFPIEVGTDVDAKSLVRSIVNQQKARYLGFLEIFAEGHQHSALQMYRYLLLPVITSKIERLESGLSYKYLNEMMEQWHPHKSNFNPGNLTQALQSAASLQIKKGVTPIILDYDQTSRRLKAVDRTFLIWLEFQDRKELLGKLGLPLAAAEEN